MSLIPYQNFVIFKTPKMFTSHVKVNGKELFFDPEFNPKEHVITYGEVVALPAVMGRHPMPLQDTVGTPAFFEYAPTTFKLLCDIKTDLKIGDKIYYHFNTINNQNLIKEEGEGENKNYFFKVRYDNIICAVRDGQIIMIGGYSLITPDLETWDDILIPTYTGINDKDGNPIKRPKEFWIQKKLIPEAKYLKGFVKHIGSPLNGDVCECSVGDHIIYRKNSDWPVKIEGEMVYAVRQRHIEGRLITEN